MSAMEDAIESAPAGLQPIFRRFWDALREEKLDKIETRITEAQARTETRLDRIDATIEKLAQAQARTEAAVERLAEAQARTDANMARLDAAVERLAEAQARTELAVQNLARQVGGLSETVGGDIEDIAYIVLHDVLKRELGWDVGVLERTWQTWNAEPEEVDVFGRATDPTDPERAIWIVGEAKHNLTLKEVARFEGQLVRAREALQGEIFPVCFCYRARPEVQDAIRKAGIRLVFSYGKLV